MKEPSIAKALLSPPGDTILETLRWKGISVEELSKALQLDNVAIHELLSGEMAIDVDLAHRLAERLQIPVSFWINRENEYQSDKRKTTA